jgi:2'-5' RNA ligase superfamily
VKARSSRRKAFLPIETAPALPADPAFVVETQSALLVPVPEAEPTVGEWRSKYDSSAALGVPAHITVLAPFVPPDLLTPAVEDELRALFAGIAAFDFRLTEVRRWPLVVYLAPEPSERFSALIEAMADRFPSYPPYGGIHEEVIPHLTVAECEREGSCADPDAILGEVERAISGVVPIEARADEVWLMTGSDRWTLRTRFPLGTE